MGTAKRYFTVILATISTAQVINVMIYMTINFGRISKRLALKQLIRLNRLKVYANRVSPV